MIMIQFSHLLMMVQHDKKTDTGKLNFGQYHCIIANREILGNIGKSRHSCAIQESKAANNIKQGLPIETMKMLSKEQLEINQGMNALPTLHNPLPWLAMAKACLSLLRLSSSAIVCCRRCAAARAPGPSCANLSSRQSP